MKKKLVRSLLSVIATGAVLVLALISALTLNRSVAWLAQNRSVTVSGMGASVDASGGENVQLRAHPISQISQIDQSTQTYTIVESIETYELPLNDPNGISYSEYKRALAVIIEFTCTEAADIEVYLTSSTADVTVAADNYVSNCIEVAPATLSDDGVTATVSGDFKSLVTVTENTCTKATSVLLQTLSIGEGNTTLCFIIEYNEAFLTYASDRVLAEGSTYSQINYQNDITFSIR